MTPPPIATSATRQPQGPQCYPESAASQVHAPSSLTDIGNTRLIAAWVITIALSFVAVIPHLATGYWEDISIISLFTTIFLTFAAASWLLIRGRHPVTLFLLPVTIVLTFFMPAAYPYMDRYVDLALKLATCLLAVVMVAWLAIPIDQAARRRSPRSAPATSPNNHSAVPVRPVIVGYTPDGQPVWGQGAITSTRTNTLAVLSLIFGLIGSGLLAVVIGHIARSQIRKSGENGGGLALAGLILGYIGVAIVLGILVLVVAVSASAP